MPPKRASKSKTTRKTAPGIDCSTRRTQRTSSPASPPASPPAARKSPRKSKPTKRATEAISCTRKPPRKLPLSNARTRTQASKMKSRTRSEESKAKDRNIKDGEDEEDNVSEEEEDITGASSSRQSASISQKNTHQTSRNTVPHREIDQLPPWNWSDDYSVTSMNQIYQSSPPPENFQFELQMRVYLGKKLALNIHKEEAYRNTFDLSEIEAVVWERLGEKENTETASMEKITVVVRTTNKTGSKTHDLEDLGFAGNERILSMLDALRKARPRSKLELLLELRIAAPEVPEPSKKRRLPVPSSDTVDILSSPPPPVKRRNRTDALKEQAEARANAIRMAGDHTVHLTSQYKCTDPNCTNLDNQCYPDPADKSIHFNITAIQTDQWASAISTGRASLLNPPVQLYNYWKNQQGGIEKGSRAPAKRAQNQIVHDGIAELLQRAEVGDIELRIRRQQNEEAKLRDKEEDREERRQELADKRAQEAETRRQMLEIRQLQMNQHMFQQQSQQAITQGPSQSLYYPPSMPQSQHLPALDHYRLSQAPRLARKSSPIAPELEDADVLQGLFDWQVQQAKSEDMKAKWRHVGEVFLDQDWSIADLKAMASGSGAMYDLARQAGITDGLIRRLKQAFNAYKVQWRKEEAARALLMQRNNQIQN